MELDVEITGSLILDLLEWVGIDSRPSSEVQATWRTSCRIAGWEDPHDRSATASPISEDLSAVSMLRSEVHQ